MADPLEPSAQFLTHAYLVLSCAVIEEFVEECFSIYVDKALAANDAQISSCLVSLATRFAGDVIGQTNTIPPAEEASPMLSGLYKSKVIGPNNGIKRKNILGLGKPLGLYDKIESDCEDLLVPMETLGARRGAVAHLGIVTEELRPAEARTLVLAAIDKLPLLLQLLDVP